MSTTLPNSNRAAPRPYRRTPPFPAARQRPTRRQSLAVILPARLVVFLFSLTMYVHGKLHNTRPLDVVKHPSFPRTRDQIPQLRVNDRHARRDDKRRIEIEPCEFGSGDTLVGDVLRDGGACAVYAGLGRRGVGVRECKGCVAAEASFWCSRGVSEVIGRRGIYLPDHVGGMLYG